MPSPFAHAAVGYTLYRLTRSDTDKKITLSLPVFRSMDLPSSLLVSLGLSLAPDLDAIAGLAFHDMANFHNNGTHSLLVGAAVSLLVAFLASRKARLQGAAWRASFWRWFAIAFSSYGVHIFMDFLTRGGRGVRLLWPLVGARFIPVVEVFYGVDWGAGWFSVHHLVTFGTELIFIALLFGGLWLFEHLQKVGRGVEPGPVGGAQD